MQAKMYRKDAAKKLLHNSSFLQTDYEREEGIIKRLMNGRNYYKTNDLHD